MLGFLRDHVDAGETYRLGAADLEYGELLPAKPRGVEQDEYEERTRVGFALERLVKSAARQIRLPATWQNDAEANAGEPAAMTETAGNASSGFRSTRIEIEGGPEIFKIEQE